MRKKGIGILLVMLMLFVACGSAFAGEVSNDYGLEDAYGVFMEDAFNQGDLPSLDIMDMPVNGIDGFILTGIGVLPGGNQGKGIITQIYQGKDGNEYVVVSPTRNLSQIYWCFPWEGDITVKATFNNYYQELKTLTPFADLDVTLVPLTEDNFSIFNSWINYPGTSESVPLLLPRNSCYFV